MTFGSGCEELVAGVTAHKQPSSCVWCDGCTDRSLTDCVWSQSLLLPQVPCATLGSDSELVQGHGDWSMPLPSLGEIEKKFAERP